MEQSKAGYGFSVGSLAGLAILVIQVAGPRRQGFVEVIILVDHLLFRFFDHVFQFGRSDGLGIARIAEKNA